jgi:hypothetical protein
MQRILFLMATLAAAMPWTAAAEEFYCQQASFVEPATWGHIKAAFR